MNATTTRTYDNTGNFTQTNDESNVSHRSTAKINNAQDGAPDEGELVGELWYRVRVALSRDIDDDLVGE